MVERPPENRFNKTLRKAKIYLHATLDDLRPSSLTARASSPFRCYVL